MLPVLIAATSQLIFSISDIVGRYYMSQNAYTFSTFISWWFLSYMSLRTVATMGQLYVFTQLEVGKTIALFGAFSIIIVNVLGFLILQEVLSLGTYIGIMLAITAIIVMVLAR